MFKKIQSVIAMLALCAAANLAHANLVSNGGFDTGNFSGWTTTVAPYGSDFGIAYGRGLSGSPAAAFGAVFGLDDIISQTLATTAGTGYTLSFWLDASQNVTGNFSALVNGVTELSTAGVAGGYKEYTYNFFATSANTVLAFEGNTPPSFYYLDGVSVVANGTSSNNVPEPGSLSLIALALAGLVIARRKARQK